MATSAETQSSFDLEFLAKCEEELKDRFTEKDEEYMKVFNAESMAPPIVESWWVPQNSGRRNDRRFVRRNHPNERRNRDNYDNRDSGERRDTRDSGDRRDNRDGGDRRDYRSSDSRDNRNRGYSDRGSAQRRYQPY